jgi:predicted negative regulator of RcsB-dependent stress response
MYRANGREKDVPALYQDVLTRTNDPVVRHMAGRRLAQLQWRGGNKDAAMQQMQKNLDADLKRLK